MSNKTVLIQPIKFCVVGFSGMIIDFSVTWVLREKLHCNGYVANSTGFLLAATNNFIWNKYWTFDNKSKAFIKQYVTFMLVSAFCLLINNGFLWTFSQKAGLPFYTSKVIAVGATTIFNYFLNHFISFGKLTTPPEN